MHPMSDTTANANEDAAAKAQRQQHALQQVRDRLMQEKPTIDAALKSFCSWMMVHCGNSNRATASATTTAATDLSAAEVLKWTRWLSIRINRHIVSISSIMASQQRVIEEEESKQPDDTSTTPISALLDTLVPQIWNELVGQKTKVTKLLGRTSLKIVWKDLDLAQQVLQEDEEDRRKLSMFLHYFELFLIADTAAATTTSTIGVPDELLPFRPDMADAKLIWDADGGQAELARRASERQQQAAERRQQMEAAAETTTAATTGNASSSSVVITEITEDAKMPAGEAKQPE